LQELMHIVRLEEVYTGHVTPGGGQYFIWTWYDF
jgi:hypothetical protein